MKLTTTHYYHHLLQALKAARQYRAMFEAGCAVLIILLLIGLAMPHFSLGLDRAKKSAFYTQLSAVRQNAIIEYSTTGRWPIKNHLPEDEQVGYLYQSSNFKLKNILSVQGNFALNYQVSGDDTVYTEAYRLVDVHPLQPTLYWLCAYSQPRSDEVAAIPNISNVPLKLLNHNCR